MGDYNIDLLNFVTHQKANDFVDRFYTANNQTNTNNVKLGNIYRPHIFKS